MKKLLSILMVLGFVLSSHAQNSVSLRLNLNKGQVFKQYMDIFMVMDMEVMNTKMRFDIPFAAEIKYEVKDKDKAGNYIIETSYQSMKIQMDIAGQRFDYSSSDSRTNKDNEMASLFNGMINQPFVMVLDKYCNVVEVRGLDKLFENMLRDFSPAKRAIMKDAIESALGSKKVIENFESASFVFPKENVSVGYSWNNQTQKSINGVSLIVDNIYKITSINEKNIEVSYSSKWQMNTDIKQDTISTFIDVKNSDLRGNYSINRESGWVLLSDSKMFLDLEVKTKQGENTLLIPMKIDGTITIKNK